ncbi:MAG: TrkA C-terminal domain-containing protein, partial [Shewanella sp.]
EVFVYCLSESKWCIGEPLKRLAMPDGTRIAAVFRNNTLLHPSGSTCLEAGDILCVLGQEKSLEALSNLFSQAPETDEVSRFFGDFFIDTEVKLADLAPIYGLTLDDETGAMTVADLVALELGAHPVLGDQFLWQSLHWVVAGLYEGKVTNVGIRLPADA